MTNYILRRGTPADTQAVLNVFRASVRDLVPRLTGQLAPSPELTPAEIAGWERIVPLMDFLATHHYQWWVAEQGDQLVGYARSILMGEVLELTEFFVLPGVQSGGIGRELLARAFPNNGPGFSRRVIDATLDVRAQSRYIKAGTAPRFPIYDIMSTPDVLTDVPTITTDLSIEQVHDAVAAQPIIMQLDDIILGLSRPEIHGWLLDNRDAYLYRRGGQVVGYGYIGRSKRGYDGPFALLDSGDFPAVLNHWERLAMVRGGAFGLEVPTIATEALGYLVGRGYHIEQFMTVLMMDRPFGDFSRYILNSPPLFI